MRELSLFTGAGGGLLGTHLLGFTPIGYVEFNDYCQRVIAARIKDGVLPDAPIFSDIRAFNHEGYATSYYGMVDVITAGFPCPCFSIASAMHGTKSENLWPDTMQTIDVVRPKRVLLENSDRVIKGGYILEIAKDLDTLGYGVRWDVISAAEFGADHYRPRSWIIADANSKRLQRIGELQEIYGEGGKIETRRKTARSSNQADRLKRYPAPYFCGKSDDVAHRVDRLKAIGNGQVPAVARTAWKILTGG